MPPTRLLPRYERLATELIAGIDAGRFPVGTLLPTEHQLADQHKLSRQTVRRALERLVDLGLVNRQPGVGTRVLGRHEPSLYSYSIRSMADLAQYANEVHLNVESLERIRVWGTNARRLACREGTEWWHLRGRRFHEGDERPVAVSEMYLRAEYPGIEQRLRQAKVPIHSLLETEHGEIVEEIRQDIRATPIDEADARLLDVAAQSAGLEIVRRYFGSASRMVLIGRVIHPFDRFTLSMSFRRDSEPRSPDSGPR